MLTTAIIAVIVLAGQSSDTDPSERLQTEVRKLVRQLDGGLAEREAAEKALVELGPAALDLLPRITPRTSPQAKYHLQRIRDALYRQAVEAATQQSVVTLKMDDKPLSAVLAEIERQTGNKIVDKRGEFGQAQRDVEVSVNFDNTPFWRALDDVLDQAELTTYNYTGEKQTIALMARQAEMLPRSSQAGYSGAFRFAGLQIESVRDLRNPANKGLKLLLEIAWEPRLMPIALSQPLSALSATDENGDEIAVDGRSGTVEPDVDPSMSATEVEFPFVLPERNIKRIASLKGTLTVLVPGRVEKFQFGELLAARDAEQKKAGASVLLQTVRKNGDVYEVRMVLRFDKAANALESHRSWVLNNDAYLVDSKGERVENAGYESTLRTVNEVGFSYKFVLDGDIDGHQFVYETPAAIVKMQIPYELTDLPLP